ncbi:MAG: T9SS type A sorting domain-containing protein, partial [Ignavibacteriaceae bacterium]
MDSFLIDRTIGSSTFLAIPYTANKTGGYDWVDISKGFSSSCAWFIFAKHGFNPFTFDINFTTDVKETEQQNMIFHLNQNFPNPFNLSTTIIYFVSKPQQIEISIFDILGSKVLTLFKDSVSAGENQVSWDGK